MIIEYSHMVAFFFLINYRWFKFVIKCLWVAFFFHFEKSVFCFIKSPLWSNNKFSQPLYEYTNSHAAIPCSYFTHFQASRRHTIWVFSWYCRNLSEIFHHQAVIMNLIILIINIKDKEERMRSLAVITMSSLILRMARQN